jgi:hypothetical protein
MLWSSDWIGNFRVTKFWSFRSYTTNSAATVINMDHIEYLMGQDIFFFTIQESSL